MGLANTKGALIDAVEKDSPAEKAGVLAQDIIQKVNGKQVDTYIDVTRAISNTAPGTKVMLSVWRKGGQKEVAVIVGETPGDARVAKASEKKDDKKDATPDRLGLFVGEVGADALKAMKIESGVLVNDADGAGERAGIRKGDVILAVNNTDVKSVAQYNQIVAKLDAKKPVALLVKRENQTRYVTLRIDSK